MLHQEGERGWSTAFFQNWEFRIQNWWLPRAMVSPLDTSNHPVNMEGSFQILKIKYITPSDP